MSGSAGNRPAGGCRPGRRGAWPPGWPASDPKPGGASCSTTRAAASGRSSRRWPRPPRRRAPRSGWRPRSTGSVSSRTRSSSPRRTATWSPAGTRSPRCRCRCSHGSAARRRRWRAWSRRRGCGSARCCWCTWSTRAAAGRRTTLTRSRRPGRRSPGSPSRRTSATVPPILATVRCCAPRSRAR